MNETSLSHSDAALIKGMLKRGDRQSDIAAFFGVNGGRVSEINTGHKFAEVSAVTEDKLPPSGPYPIGRSSVKARETLIALRELIDEALNDIDLYEQRRDRE